MLIYLMCVLILVLFSVRKPNDIGREVLSLKDTTVINGIFTLLIFLSHSTQYIHLSDTILDLLYGKFQNFHNQWVVATFLAFSGYGVMLKIKSGGVEYLKKYPKHRILRTLFNYDIAVILYLLVNIFIHSSYTWQEILLSFIGLTSVGQSNWYIFDILLLYVISYIAATLFKENYLRQCIAVTGLSMFSITVMMLYGMDSRFISTFLCYAAGVWTALYKNELVDLFKRKKWMSIAFLELFIIVTYKLRWNDLIMNFSSIAVVLVFVWFNTFWVFKSSILHWIGTYAFSIFILQRIPMGLLTYFGLAGFSPYLLVIVSFVVTVGLAVVFDKYLKIVDKKLLGD